MRRNVLAGSLVALVLAIGATVIGIWSPAADAADSTIKFAESSTLNIVGQPLTREVQLTHGGDPVIGAEVAWAVVQGPNVGEGGVSTTDGAGIAALSYVGAAGGRDVVQAKFVDADGDLNVSQPATAYWVASEPTSITIEQAVDTRPVGTTHTVTATVTDAAAQPVAGVAVFVEAVQAGEELEQAGTTDGAGTVTVGYTRETAGPEEIEAHVYPIGLGSNALTNTWTPIGTLVLEPASTMLAVGADHTLSARATDKDGNPVVGTEVGFAVFGVNEVSGNATTDADGIAQFTYTGENAGFDPIQAMFDDPDGNPVESNGVQAGWVAGEGPQLALSPVTWGKLLISEHTVHAVAAVDGVAVSGTEVTFEVLSGPSRGATGTATTDASGIAEFRYPGTFPGTDLLEARFDNNGEPVVSNQATVEWLQGRILTLTPETATNPVGAVHTVTATLTSSGTPVADASIRFLVNGANWNLLIDDVVTDSSGSVTFSYAGFLPGTDQIRAFDATPARFGATHSNEVTAEWVAEPAAHTLVLAPESSTNPVGTEHQMTATLTDGAGDPVAGVDVGFEVTSGPNAGLADSATTDASGVASFSYTGASAGTDTIVASATVDDTPVTSNSVTKEWVAEGLALVLAPVETTIPNSQFVSLTATLTNGGVPVPDVEVTFTADFAHTDMTNASGVAQLTFGYDGVGPQVWVATATVEGVPVISNEATVIWTQGVPATIELTPASATNPVGAEHEVVALVLDDEGQTVPNIVVTFTVTGGPNAGTSRTGTTTPAGTASFSYTGAAPGTDTIVATADADGTTITSNTATKEWVEEPPGLTLTLAPESATNPVGTEHTVAATLLEGDTPVEGVEVSFVVTGPNATSGTGMTDAAGVASFTYTGAAVGSDSIVASATVEGTPVMSNTATKTWVEPSAVTLVLAPVSAENPVGADHTVTATLLDGGAPLVGVEVSFVVSGANATSGTAMTDAAGVASFTYTGDAAGSDSIVASATVEGTPVMSNTAAKTWVDADVFDDVHLRALWGPAAQRSLAYENGGTLTAGDYVVDPDSGEPTSIDGTGTLPSSSGDGDATIAFHLVFDEGTNKWGGTVEIDDPGADFTAEIPVFAGPQRITRDGGRIEGMLYGIKRLSTPQKCFELHFKIDDGNASGEEPVEEVADGHLRIPARWAHHTRRHWRNRASGRAYATHVASARPEAGFAG